MHGQQNIKIRQLCFDSKEPLLIAKENSAFFWFVLYGFIIQPFRHDAVLPSTSWDTVLILQEGPQDLY